MQTLNPVQANERETFMDVLQGFASSVFLSPTWGVVLVFTVKMPT